MKKQNNNNFNSLNNNLLNNNNANNLKNIDKKAETKIEVKDNKSAQNI